MELREVNVNIAPPLRGKKAPMATYVNPPRSTATTLPAPPAAAPPTNYGSQYGYSPEEMLRMAEASYAECPCPTCAYYRAYYMAQVHGTCLHAQAPAAVAPRASLRTVGAVPIMSVKPAATPAAPASAGPVYADPATYENAAVLSAPRVAAPRPPRATAAAADPIAAFHAQCPGHVAELARTTQGKAVLQSAIRTQDPAVLEVIVAELCEDLDEVALDANGCHVVRAVVESCTAEQTAALVGTLHETLILNMSTVSQYTRRILQSLFERHLVDLRDVVEVLARNSSYLAATQQGCISLMRVYELCDAASKAALMEPLLPAFPYIARDPFGNYVVQCAVEHSGDTVAAQYTLMCFTGRLLSMSCDKFASNVVEKIIRSCGHVPAVRRLLLDELIYNPASLQEMVTDGYGNFVVQSIIESTTHPAELKRISDRLRPTLPGSPFAARIEAKLKVKKGAAAPVYNQHQPQHQPQPHTQQQQQQPRH